ncbi:class I SAM-dependent methyltransferase [Flavihumibacter solisilvae]|uniref:class I SAM-dependent methyltransferase n=1 Tax=Flavihumibacter solisilvae TaxID=1349421 RepID=UPI001364B31B|nr:class I SAM-dependent methyltransferase [Flavihumibacter solisilvae]
METPQLSRLYRNRAGVAVDRFFNRNAIDYLECEECNLRFYWPQAIGDGLFYDELQNYRNYYLQDKQEYRDAAVFVHPTDDILEIGPGEGKFTSYINYHSYLGLEFSEKAILTARNNGINMKNEDIRIHAAQHEQQYDVVCFFQVLEHVANPRDFLEAAVHCLKPGGRLILAVPSDDSFIRVVVNSYLNMPPHHASRWPDKTLGYVAKLFDLKLLKIVHEKLHFVHRSFYDKTMLHHSLRKWLGLKEKMLDGSILNMAAYCMATIGSKFMRNGHHHLVTGQSVLVAYQKKCQ